MRRRHRQLVMSARRLAVAVAGLAYLAAAFGFPLPVRPNPNPSSSFPCQGRACGCSTAEQCRRACCCFRPVSAPSCPHCAGRARDREEGRPQAPFVWVLGSRHRECRGLTTVWITTGAALPAPPPVEAPHDGPPAGWLRPGRLAALGRKLPPAIPPPRPT